LPLVRNFDGRVAVVGLPCDITALKRKCSKEPDLSKKIVLAYGLFCGHNSRAVLIDEITDRIERKAGKKIIGYRFRVGHWRGEIEADLEDGEVFKLNTQYFNDYHNLFFFSQRKCLICNDHYAYDADISFGDVWSFRLRNDPIKYSGVIVRTGLGMKEYVAASNKNIIISTKVDICEIIDGQSRIGPFHYNVSARHKAGMLLNIKLKDTVKEKVYWNEYLNAIITLSNVILSERSWGKRLIFLIPHPILKLYLYFKKGLESIK